jgi:hypothetical protein
MRLGYVAGPLQTLMVRGFLTALFGVLLIGWPGGGSGVGDRAALRVMKGETGTQDSDCYSTVALSVRRCLRSGDGSLLESCCDEQVYGHTGAGIGKLRQAWAQCWRWSPRDG